MAIPNSVELASEVVAAYVSNNPVPSSDLPSDYPMVAPNYAAQRSVLAKKIGLGRKRKAG